MSLYSKKQGAYKIKVGWNFSKPFSGNYSITLDQLEAAGETPALKAQQLLDGWYENEAPGAAVAVVKEGKLIFKATKGLANIDLFLSGELRDQKPNLKNFPVVSTVLKNIEAEENYRESIDLTPYEGVYCSEELSAVWNLKINQGRLEIRHPRMDGIPLKNTGTDKFGFIEFKRNEANKITGLKALGEGIEFKKMD